MPGNLQGIPDIVLPFTGNEIVEMDTELTQGQNPATVTASMSQMASFFGGGLPMVSGRFYGLPRGATPVAVLTVTGTIYAYPVYIPNPVTVSSLNLSCTTGQTGGAARLGIYKDNGAGYPGALVYDSGAIAGLTSTTIVTKSGVNQVLQAGWYWVTSIFTASGTFPSVAGITTNYSVETNAQLGSDTAAHSLAASGQAATGISVAGVYGAYPTTFPSGATLILNAATPLVSIGV